MPDRRLILSGGAAKLVAALSISVTIAGCAPAHFNTELTAPDGLVPGNPVTSLGADVGTVTSLTPLADGNTGVGFDVNHGDNRLLMQDSIMVLRQDKGPYLEILNTNPLSIRAPEGATIVGASDQREADLLLAARGLPSYGGGLAAMAGAAAAISSAAAATSGAAAASVPPAAATANALQQQFQSLQNWYLANSAHNAAIATQELDRIEQSAAALERELINQGRSAEAQRLRDQIDQLARTLTTTPPPPPSGSTLVTPPIH